MKLKLMAGAALVGMCAAGANASAQPADTGWYGAIDIGAHFDQRLNTVSGANTGDVEDTNPFHLRFHQNTDWVGFARIGYKLSPHVRIELEGGYRPGDLSRVTNAGGTDVQAICGLTATDTTCPRPGGSIETWSVMGNLLFDLIPNGMIDPYVGGGAGVAHVNLRMNGTDFPNEEDGTFNINGGNTKFAWQGIAGLGFRINDQLTADLTYRYFQTQAADYTLNIAG